MAALTGTEVNAVAARDKTLAQVTREKTATVRATRLALPDAKYRVIYADPPWKYNDKADAGSVQAGGSERKYPVMSIKDLCALDVQGDLRPGRGREPLPQLGRWSSRSPASGARRSAGPA